MALVLTASSMRGGWCMGGGVRARWQSAGCGGAISSADFNRISGHVPLFVYYQVVVLFNKWYVSYRAVAII